MKEFMMIFVGGDYESDKMSPEEMQRRMGLWDAWVQDLQKEDLFIDGKALKNATVKVNEDGVSTDGAFVEIKELVTGYFVFKARDIDHAAELTKGYPDYDIGGHIEIREIQQF